MRHHIALLALSSLAAADVLFTSPSAGERIPAGTLRIQWQESGIPPLIDEEVHYSLRLMTGGNEDDNMYEIFDIARDGKFDSSNEISAEVPSLLAQSTVNGLYVLASISAETVLIFVQLPGNDSRRKR